MKISDILGFKHNGLEAVEAKLNGNIVWILEEEINSGGFIPIFSAGETSKNGFNITWDDTATNWGVTSDNVYQSFDNNDDTALIMSGLGSTKGASQNIQIEFPYAIIPKTIYQKHSADWGGLEILMSSDGSTWDTVYAINNEDGTSKKYEDEQTLGLSGTSAYKYLKISCKQTVNSSTDQTTVWRLNTIQITEWEEV